MSFSRIRHPAQLPGASTRTRSTLPPRVRSRSPSASSVLDLQVWLELQVRETSTSRFFVLVLLDSGIEKRLFKPCRITSTVLCSTIIQNITQKSVSLCFHAKMWSCRPSIDLRQKISVGLFISLWLISKIKLYIGQKVFLGVEPHRVLYQNTSLTHWLLEKPDHILSQPVGLSECPQHDRPRPPVILAWGTIPVGNRLRFWVKMMV